MKRLFNNITRRGLQVILLAVSVLTVIGAAEAMPVEHYAANSRLASGRWRKVEVKTTGMQLITNAQLKTMGFSNPAKVNVYGYGGRKVSDLLNTNKYVDDVPQQPVVRTADGIIFYGVNTMSWELFSNRNTPYKPILNPYSLNSYYFVSDVEPDSVFEMPVLNWQPNETIEEHTTTFVERLLHKKEEYAPSNTGNWMLGEDFTQQNTREFKFKLPGLADTSAALMIGFGTHTRMAASSYTVSVDGQPLAEETGMTIPLCDGDAQFINYNLCPVLVPVAKEDMTVSITYKPGGTLYLARLGFIEVNYNRKLDITDGPLTFYNTAHYNLPCVYEISGATEQTQIWDVTKPEAPARIEYKLENGKALFSPGVSSYREYVAFNPGTVKTNPTPVNAYITNQNVHGQDVPDMVIISPREYLEQAKRIAEMHDRLDGMDTYIVTPEALYNEFSSGAPDVTAYRKALKMWYDRDPKKLKYCLILGRPTYDQRQITNDVKTNYPRPLIYQSPGEETADMFHSSFTSKSFSICTDDYIVMLEDNNRSSIELANLDLSIAVGRMPFRGVEHARQMVDKLINYCENPKLGPARNTVTLVADDGDHLDHLRQTLDSWEILLQNGGEKLLYKPIFLSTLKPTMTTTGKEFPTLKAEYMRSLEKGTGVVWYIGHANPREWTHENFFTYTDICNLDNTYWPVFMTATCEFTRWDANDVSGGEILWSHPESGAISLISTVRTAFMSGNDHITQSMSRYFFSKDSAGRTLSIGEGLRLAKNNTKDDNNNLIYQVIGDPAMRLSLPTMNAEVEILGGVNPDTVNAPDYPIFKGGSTVKFQGVVKRGKNVARDFNGTMCLTLYDAERVVTTQDETQKEPLDFNARTNKLYEGRVKVAQGRWKAEIPISADIENNYQPASLYMYAYSDEGQEANGICQQFYVYGLDEQQADNEGPEITGMGLNTYNFKNGDHVTANPIFFASFKDESGINISKLGIGTTMEICIDDKDYYTDLTEYYLPSTDDSFAGSLAYPLSDLAPGRHTLCFKVCDNLGNATTKSLEFAVSVNKKPILYDVTTDCNPATTSVTFTLMHDRLSEVTESNVAVYDLSGRKIWTGKLSGRVHDLEQGGSTVSWDLTDGSGRRVPRGIYLYRATIMTDEGISVSKTNKLAVTAQ